jgi:hypothetical protein
MSLALYVNAHGSYSARFSRLSSSTSLDSLRSQPAEGWW